jgi:hypothetical protein
MRRLPAEQVGALDPYAFLAVQGKPVIHPGGLHRGQGRATCLISFPQPIVHNQRR